MTEPIECECGHAWRQHNDIGQCGVDFRIGDRLLPCLCEQYRAAVGDTSHTPKEAN